MGTTVSTQCLSNRAGPHCRELQDPLIPSETVYAYDRTPVQEPRSPQNEKFVAHAMFREDADSAILKGIPPATERWVCAMVAEKHDSKTRDEEVTTQDEDTCLLGRVCSRADAPEWIDIGVQTDVARDVTLVPSLDALIEDAEGDSREKSQEKDDDTIIRAALVVESALQGFLIKDETIDYGKCCETRSDLQKTVLVENMVARISIGLLAFTMIETPLWCQTTVAQWTYLPAHERCPMPDVTTGPLWSMVPYLPPAWGLIVEAGALVLLSLCIWREWDLRMRYYERFEELRRLHQVFTTTLLCVMWCDLLAYAVVRHRVRVAPLARVCLGWSWPWLRSVVAATCSVLPQLLNVAAFSVLTTLFFTWLMLMVVMDLRTDDGYRVAEDIFSSPRNAFYSMFQLTVGSNFPDDVLPVYSAARWTILLYFVFLLLTYVLFTNLMLAVVYKVYQDHRTEEVKTFFLNRVDGLARGFELLKVVREEDGETTATMSRDIFRALFGYLVDTPQRTSLRKEYADYIFGALDEDGSGDIDIGEFFELSENLLMLDLTICAEDTWFVRYFNLFSLKVILKSRWHTIVMTGLLISNVCLTFYESVSDLRKRPEPAWSNPIELLYSVAYMVDVVLRLLVVSFQSFWACSGNRFDFYTSIVLFIASALAYCGVVPQFLIRYLNILRMLKLVMLVEKVPHLAFMFRCIMRILLVCKEVMVLMFLVWVVFGIVAVQAWGGEIYPSNPALQDTDLMKNQFYAMNFNDMPMAICTLFMMLIMGYSSPHANALYQLSSFGTVYCLAYYFIAVVMVFNILAAFTIDVFMAQEDEPGKDSQENESKQIEQMNKLVQEEGLVLHVSESSEMLKHKMQVALFQDTWKQMAGARRAEHEAHLGASPDHNAETSSLPASSKVAMLQSTVCNEAAERHASDSSLATAMQQSRRRSSIHE